jgi:hypothetical protein
MSRHLEHDHRPPAPDDVNSAVNHDIVDALVTNIDIVQQQSHQAGGGHVYVGQAGSKLFTKTIVRPVR